MWLSSILNGERVHFQRPQVSHPYEGKAKNLRLEAAMTTQLSGNHDFKHVFTN